MRLLSPSPGEVIDRMTILDLKIQVSGKKGTDAGQFLAEKASLENFMEHWDRLLKEDDQSPETYDSIRIAKTGLVAVNSLLWDAEEQVRILPETEMVQLAQLAKRIAKLNDSRSALVREISSLYGAPEAVGEKMYGVSLGRAV